MGRHFGQKTSKCKYNLMVFDYNSDEPSWITYTCCSYPDIINVLKEKHDIKMTRDVVQNIVLNRYNKKGQYKYIKINKI